MGTKRHEFLAAVPMLMAAAALPSRARAAVGSVEAQADPDAARSALSADDALRRLLGGNRRFVNGNAAHPNQDASRRSAVSPAQKPFAIVLGCADSRLPVEIVFDQGLGDVFVCRVAGNIIDPVVTGSIEYAVDHFHVPLVVVLGHDRCGAVAATIDAAISNAPLPGDIGSRVAAIRPAIATLPPSRRTDIDACVRANARYVAAQLRSQSGVIASRSGERAPRIVPAVYRLETGRVELLS